MLRRFRRLLYEASASQMVEEALLLGISFVMLAVVIGLVQKVTGVTSSYFDQAWKAMSEASQGLFSWAKR